MAACGCTTGMLLWKKPCEQPAHDACATCGKPLCASHSHRQGPGEYFCAGCFPADNDVDTSSDSSASSYTDRSGSTGAERAAAAESTWHGGGDSGSSDSGSSDSGGGDSSSSSD